MGKNVGDVKLEDFDYDLPEEAIAQTPVEPRDAARLLVDRGPGRQPDHRVVADLPLLVRPGDAIVINTTRVLSARLRLQKATGGTVEILLLEPIADSADNTDPPDTWEALVRPGRRVAPGTALTAGGGLVVTVGGPGSGDGTRRVTLQMPTGLDPTEALARYGLVPLPPYIGTPLADPERYQTVYAERPESVAAPTAGLHLTAGVLDACRAAGADIVPLELAVGLGTFRPIAAPRVEDHRLHPERYRIPSTTLDACRSARRVVAIGTTVVRALEASAVGGELAGRTGLFIHRPFDWQVVDVLLTNFHLPRSSLLVLLDAFMGPRWRELYGIALMKGYRFLSFGDAMVVSRGDGFSELRGDQAPGKPSSGGAV
jgi:S-adenosylmethionine:tRNA ribosyltransferase-isomerase